VAADDAAAIVRDRRTPLVERHAGDRNPAVADTPEDEAARDRLPLSGRPRDEAAALLLDELVPHHLDPLDALLAEDRDRRGEEPQDDPSRLARGRPRRVLTQQVDVPARALPVRLELARARRVELEVGRIDDRLRTGELAELLQLRGRERRLHRSAPAEHDDLFERR